MTINFFNTDSKFSINATIGAGKNQIDIYIAETGDVDFEDNTGSSNWDGATNNELCVNIEDMREIVRQFDLWRDRMAGEK